MANDERNETLERQAWAEMETVASLITSAQTVDAMLKAAVVDGEKLTGGEQLHFRAAYEEAATLPSVPRELAHMDRVQGGRRTLAGQVMAALLNNLGQNEVFEMATRCPEGVARLVEASVSLAGVLTERLQERDEKEREGFLAFYQDRAAYAQARAEARVRRLRETGGAA